MSHSVITRERWNATTRRLSIMLVVTVVACVTGLLVADVATAQQGVERSGSSVTVELPETDEDEAIETVEMTVDGTDIRYVDENIDESDETTSLPVSHPTSGTVDGVSLTNETVTMEFQTEDGVLEEETITTQLSLHAVTFEDEVPVWIADETVHVPLNGSETTGVTTGDSVEVSVGDDQWSETVQYDGEQLEIDQENIGIASDSETVSVDVVAANSDESVTTNGPYEIEPEIRSNDNGLVVWSPLFEPETTYDVRAVDANGDSYDETTQPDASGQIELPSLEPGKIEVRVSEDNTEVVNRAEDDAPSYDGPLMMDAEVTDDGGTLAFDRSLAGLSVTALAADPEDGEAYYTSLDAEIDDEGQLGVDEPLETNDTVVVSTDAGVAAVQPQSVATAESGLIRLPGNLVPLGVAFIVPLFIGVLVGGFGAWSGKRPTIKNKLVIGGFSLLGGLLLVLGVLELLADPLSLSLSHMSGGAGILAGTVAAVGIYQWKGAAAVDPSGQFTAEISFDPYQPARGSFRLEKQDPDDIYNGWKHESVNSNPHRMTVPNTKTLELRAVRDGKTLSKAKISRTNQSAKITVSVQKTIMITDTDGNGIPDARVRIGTKTDKITNRDGTVSVTLQGDVNSVEAEISHEKYESKTVTVPVDNRDQTVRLDRRMGELRIVTSVDGVTTGPIPVEVEVDEDTAAMPDRTGTVTTDVDGEFADSVMIGQYRILSSLTSNTDVFRADEKTITVRDGMTAPAEINLQFTGHLTPGHRERIDRIRADVRSLSDGRGQDTAIQQYYGSVVESILSTVESVPDSGHAFVGTEPEPAVAIETMLAMADAATTAINNAMTTKRNVDLFAACSDLPPADIRWDGECELADLLGRLDEFDSEQASRSEIKERYKTVGDRIQTERSEVAEISPVLEMHERTWEMVSESGRGTEAIGVHYGALLLLDAVESVFDHEPLSERLSRTVF